MPHEPEWRYDSQYPAYAWRVTRWKLEHEINGNPIDVDDEWGEEYSGSPDAIRKALTEVIDDDTLREQLRADLEQLEKEEP